MAAGNLLQTLHRHGLVDEWQILAIPVVLGQGRRLFAEGAASASLRLTHTSTSASGIVVSRYAPAGDVAKGTL